MVAVRAQIDDVKALTFEFKVKSVPWLLVIDPHKREKLAERIGYVDAAEFLAFLGEGHAKFAPPAQEAAGGGTDVRVRYKRTGLSIETADSEVVVDLWSHLLVQAIEFPDDFGGETERVRHARFGMQATIHDRWTLFAQWDFAQSSPLLDAYAEYQVTRPINLRAGRFKTPMGTEFLPRRDFWDFVEPAGYVFGLLPRRDVGAMVSGGGQMFDLHLKYAVGGFGGVQDGTSDGDGEQETAVRVSLIPFPTPEFELTLSFAWMGGDSRQSLAAFQVSDDGITNLVGFPAAVRYDGRRYRRSLEAELLWRNFSVGAEHVLQASRITNDAVATDRYDLAGTSAWIAWVVTGEKKSRDDWLTPSGSCGAWEVVARYSTFDADRDLGALATAGRFTRGAVQWLAGVNWYANRHARVMFDVQRSRFDDDVSDGSGGLEDRHTAVLSGVELRF